MTDPVETRAPERFAIAKDGHTYPIRQDDDLWAGDVEYIRADLVDALVADAVKAEREACANEAETEGWPVSMSAKHYDALTMYEEGGMDYAERIAAAIRARGGE